MALEISNFLANKNLTAEERSIAGWFRDVRIRLITSTKSFTAYKNNFDAIKKNERVVNIVGKSNLEQQAYGQGYL